VRPVRRFQWGLRVVTGEKLERRIIMGGMSGIVRTPDLCFGCRTCELACSFHQTGAFAPEQSSIRVTRSNQTGVITWRVDSSCDGCMEEDRPLCIQYCSYGALRQRGES
jgi:Fe-S-cluster-containing hydrogenase component 2